MYSPYTITENGDSLEVTAQEAVTLAQIGIVYQCEDCPHTFHLVAPHGFFAPDEMPAAWLKLETALATLRSEGDSNA